MKIDRLLAIVILLMNRKRISAKELAEYFEVNVRTIYRDIDAICQAGIPVAAYQGSNGGFCLMENYKLDRYMLSTDDLSAIVMALKGIEFTLQDNKINATIEKVKLLINENTKTNENATHSRIIFDYSAWSSGQEYRNKLTALNKAIEEHLVIEFIYIDSQGNDSRRTVEPVSLLFKNYTWYLYGYCKIRADYRLFRVSRVRQLEVRKEKFEIRSDSGDNPILKDEWTSRTKRVELLLRFSSRARVRVEDNFNEDEITVNADGTLDVKVTYPEDEWVYGMIMSYGPDVKVLEPGYIRESIIERSKKVIDLYNFDLNMT
ncbi:MAG: helix-turn-helix transcriptional regulator [Bacillota bacterium]